MKHLAACLLVLLTPLLAAAKTGDIWESRFYEGKNGKRGFRVFVPTEVRPLSSLTPLVVMLHGCKFTSEKFAEATGMNEVARREKFTVLYPEQSTPGHRLQCWNWFLDANQKRDTGEAALLADLVNTFLDGNPNIDRKRVFVAGHSAGGSMTAVLAYCYPDVFAAAAVSGGIGYRFATALKDSGRAMENGATRDLKVTAEEAKACMPGRSRSTPLLILHGDKDPIVTVKNASQMVEQATLAGAKAKLMLIPGGTHEWSRNPSSSDAIWEFFKKP